MDVLVAIPGKQCPPSLPRETQEPQTMSVLGNHSVEEFLNKYWQKSPW